METESLIHKDLRQKGHQLYMESAAQVSLLNFERVSSFLCIKYLSGRIFGAARAQVGPSCTVCCMPVAPR